MIIVSGLLFFNIGYSREFEKKIKIKFYNLKVRDIFQNIYTTKIYNMNSGRVLSFLVKHSTGYSDKSTGQ